MSAKLKGEIALVVGTIVAALEAVNATVIHPPTWLHVVIAVLVAGAGAVGVRQNVTPTS